MSHGPTIVFYILLLLLPISALIARRIPIVTLIKFVAIWAAIFAIGTVIVTAIP